MAKVKCPSCEAELDLADDPRLAQLVEQLEQSNKTIARLSEQVEKAGQRVPPEAKKVEGAGRRMVKRYDGILFDRDEEEEEDGAGHGAGD